MGATATADVDLSTRPPQLEYKSAATGVLLGHDDEQGIVEALVSITGIVDDQGDLIPPGAYAESLAKRKSKGVRHHDWTRMAAKTLIQEEWMPGDPRLPKTLPNGDPWPKEAGALYIKGQYNLETKDGQEGYSNAKFYKDEGQWSIGYKGVKGHVKRRADGVRVLGKVDFYEWSDVLHGANTSTSTLGVKAAEGAGDEDMLGPDWLSGVLATVDTDGKSRRDAEQARRGAVETALEAERAAERKRRADADRAVDAADGETKTELQAAERERRRKWQEAYDSARDAERGRRRKWAAQQRGSGGTKSAEQQYPELAGDLELGIEDDALTDDAGAGDGGQKDVTVDLETKVRDVLPGSYEERREALREAARGALAGPKNADGMPEWWVYVVGTWDDRIVVNRSPRGDGETQTWQIPYTIGDDGAITLGEMVRVELVAQVVPAAKSGQVADATIDSVANLIHDAAAQLSLALTADAAGVKGLQVGDADAERLRDAGLLLLDTLAEAGIDVDGEVDETPEGAKGDDGGEAETKTGEPSGGGMVLDLADMQATLAGLRAE